MPTFFTEGHYMTVAEVAKKFIVTRRTVQQWIDKGWLKSTYFGGTHHIEVGQLKTLPGRPKPGPRTK